jgi:transcription elongation GreA/GreB family factor
MTLKQKIYTHYLQLVQEKVNSLQQVLADLKESGTNETKSTAGDKHETALAMLQIEQANVRNQLKEVQLQLAVLEKIDASISPVSIVPGSLIKTNKGYLFLSIAAGKASIEGHTIMALSPQSPLGKQLLSLNSGDTASINYVQYHIEHIE